MSLTVSGMARPGQVARLASGKNATVMEVGRGSDSMIVVSSALTPDHFTSLATSIKKLHIPGPGSVYIGGLAAVYDTFLQDSQQDLQNSERAGGAKKRAWPRQN